MKDDLNVEGFIVAFFIVLVLVAAWLAPIILLSRKIDDLRNEKQEIVIRVEYVHPEEPSEDALEISTNY